MTVIFQSAVHYKYTIYILYIFLSISPCSLHKHFGLQLSYIQACTQLRQTDKIKLEKVRQCHVRELVFRSTKYHKPVVDQNTLPHSFSQTMHIKHLPMFQNATKDSMRTSPCIL